ncbi:MAG: pilus assembly protein PilM [Candidatus Acidiferrales bacterium]
MSSAAGVRRGIYRSAFVRRVVRMLDSMPHPLVACEISPDFVAAANWRRGTYGLDEFAVVPLPPGAIKPSAVESNVINVDAVRSAMDTVLKKLGVRNQTIALLVPDAVIRVFVLHFDTFPRSAAEANPMLRWRLKKSVPFEAEETLISYMRQAPRDEGVDIITALARLRIIKEYESLAEASGVQPGVVMSSTLATLPLLDDARPVMLARVSGATLTTGIAREGILAGYRCTELPSGLDALEPKTLLDELFPVAAYYQDAWSEGIQGLRLAGFGNRFEDFRVPLEAEFGCPVTGLLHAADLAGKLSNDARRLAEQELDSLVGWSMNRGS